MSRLTILLVWGALTIPLAAETSAQTGKQWSYGNRPYYSNPAQYGYGKAPYYRRPPVSYYGAPFHGQPYLLMPPSAFGFTVPYQANYPQYPTVVYPYGYYGPYGYGY